MKKLSAIKKKLTKNSEAKCIKKRWQEYTAELYKKDLNDPDNHDDVISTVKRHMEDGPMYFPPDMATDNPVRFLVSEIVREKLLMYLNEERIA